VGVCVGAWVGGGGGGMGGRFAYLGVRYRKDAEGEWPLTDLREVGKTSPSYGTGRPRHGLLRTGERKRSLLLPELPTGMAEVEEGPSLPPTGEGAIEDEAERRDL
jgi:hypothetical protein